MSWSTASVSHRASALGLNFSYGSSIYEIKSLSFIESSPFANSSKLKLLISQIELSNSKFCPHALALGDTLADDQIIEVKV